MPSSEFSEWMAYYGIEPFGEERADLRAGMMTAPLVNLWVGKGKRKAKPSDWVMIFGPKEAQDPEVMKYILKGLAAAHKKKKKTAGQKKPRTHKK